MNKKELILELTELKASGLSVLKGVKVEKCKGCQVEMLVALAMETCGRLSRTIRELKAQDKE